MELDTPFEWDEDKSKVNLRKHGADFEEAKSVFLDDLSTVVPDPDHSLKEHRQIIVGESSRQRLLVVSYTERSGVIRLISARTATRIERRKYEEGSL